MKPEDIHLTDWMRMLLGEVPWSFLLEITLRIIFLYVLILVSMRLMGRRMSGQMSRLEMAALVSLAASVGIPMQAPDRVLLPAVVVAAAVIGVQRWVAYQAYKSPKFETAVLDDIGILVKDGRFEPDVLREVSLAQERAVAHIRSEGIDQLGRVKRLYLESNGRFTIQKQEPPQPGLSLVPEWDKEMAARQVVAPDTWACGYCGQLEQAKAAPSKSCPHCSSTEWKQAVQS